MKKGQSMSLNVIVIAALVILVLIVLSIIFIRGGGNFSQNSQLCELQGGKCAEACGSDLAGTQDYSIQRTDLTCLNAAGKEDSTKVCCLGIK